MNDKLTLLEIASKKVAINKEFIAYFLSNYIEIEQTTESTLISALRCTPESYYKLGLCKAPSPNEDDYLTRLNNIAGYTGIPTLELNKIIKRVDTVLKLRNSLTDENNFLMAARDKKKDESDN